MRTLEIRLALWGMQQSAETNAWIKVQLYLAHASIMFGLSYRCLGSPTSRSRQSMSVHLYWRLHGRASQGNKPCNMIHGSNSDHVRTSCHFACVLPTIVLQVGVTTKSMYAVVVLVLEFGSMGVSVLVCVQLLLVGTRQRCEHRS